MSPYSPLLLECGMGYEEDNNLFIYHCMKADCVACKIRASIDSEAQKIKATLNKWNSREIKLNDNSKN